MLMDKMHRKSDKRTSIGAVKELMDKCIERVRNPLEACLFVHTLYWSFGRLFKDYVSKVLI